jgi:hypothetical protein
MFVITKLTPYTPGRQEILVEITAGEDTVGRLAPRVSDISQW